MSQGVAGEDEDIEAGRTDSLIPRDFKSLRALIVARRELLPKRLIQVADFAGALLHGFLHAARVSIDHLEQTIDHASLAQAVDVLAGARTICLLGVRRVYPVVVYLNYALQTLGARCELVDHAGGMARRRMELLGADDAVLAVSFTPYAGETLELAQIAAASGIPVVAITDSPFSPLAQLARVWMEVAETDLGGFRSLSATLALATALSVALMEQRAATSRL